MDNKLLKYGFWVGIIVLVVVIVILLLAKLKPKADITKDLPVDNAKLSFPQQQYLLLASQIYTAMAGAGTDFDTVMRIFGSLKNLDDWNALVKAFGTKSVSKWWGYSFEGTLIDWLTDELSSGEIDKVNQVLSKIGVTL